MNECKDLIIKKINDILLIDHPEWNKLTKKIKIKYIHRICNHIDNDININSMTIPLKQIKPKKLLYFCNITNKINNKIFIDYKKNINAFIEELRLTYFTNKNTIHIDNIDKKNEFNEILNKYNTMVYNTINNNNNVYNINDFINNLLGSNKDKLIINNSENNYKLINESNKIKIFFNNITIILTLEFVNNKFSKNLPTKYNASLIINI